MASYHERVSADRRLAKFWEHDFHESFGKGGPGCYMHEGNIKNIRRFINLHCNLLDIRDAGAGAYGLGSLWLDYEGIDHKWTVEANELEATADGERRFRVECVVYVDTWAELEDDGDD